MPELPEIAAYVRALDDRITGRMLERIEILGPSLLRSVEPPLADAFGRPVTGVGRMGKRITISLDRDLHLVLHLMFSGRLHWKAVGSKIGGKTSLAAFRFSSGTLLLTEAGKRRASLHLVRGDDARRALDPGGLEVLESSREDFDRALGRENHTLKRALTDPRILPGVGNAYADEILHAAKLSPFKFTRSLTTDELARLFSATRDILSRAVERVRAEVGDDFPEKLSDLRWMAVHGRYGEPCPVCGSPVQRVRYADTETNYCATCQTEGRLLADRALSRLLKEDWPRTLEEWEAREARASPSPSTRAPRGAGS
ncbi:MAG TPA: DNA-formamidopyrimidine glycosylase family protein [Gemmatimonadales bacterium]|nr:DNA-formamidopyrimidine glycosylase family protein [Gemmatimonadales bacterium]